jgi:lipopolysaccharide/colanic/teichoic acid biosynthesis glycosyltransferase
MKIVLTGASGFVGQGLVPLLAAAGVELLLAGRDTAKLKSLFPEHAVCNYSQLRRMGRGFDQLVHLALVGKSADVRPDVFLQDNHELLEWTANTATKAGIGRLVYVSSTRALNMHNVSVFAEVKRRAQRFLADFKGVQTTTVYMPMVYHDQWNGKLTALNALPRVLAKPLHVIAAAFRPTVHVRELANTILQNKLSQSPESVLLADDQDLNPVYRVVKRSVDLAFALTVMTTLFWLFALVWLAVRMDSTGPGLFSQVRVGRNQKTFLCRKFRSMHIGTPEVATHTLSHDAVTPLGRFLRTSKLDELPQVWNILRNEISLVGPRPSLPSLDDLIAAREVAEIYSVKPGITGLAQINGVDMRNAKTLANWDSYYKAMRCIPLDLKITLSTFIGVGQGDRVRAVPAHDAA